MANKKRTKKATVPTGVTMTVGTSKAPLNVIASSAPILQPLTPISIDFTSEGLNNMARKINEIIERMN